MKLFAAFVIAGALSAFCFPAAAQKYHKPYVQSIDEAEKEGITMQSLAWRYEDAVNVVDNTKCVFKTAVQQDSLANAWSEFLQAVADHLYQNHFKWGKDVKCWNRIFFRADGSVDYYLFDFKTPVTKEQSDKFRALFAAYCTGHKLGMHADRGFAQCGKVTYQDR